VAQIEQIEHLNKLCDQAHDLSNQIGAQLETGAAPETLVPLLKTQAETIVQFQTLLSDFAQAGQINAYANDIERFKISFQTLVQTADQHVQKAQQKGVRLTGIGGKPHISRPNVPGKRR
jgi:hypothetical protein